jgi:PAS domain S-box-containing protein
VGVTILDAERKITYANPALEKILDISKEDLLKGNYAGRTYLRSDGTPIPVEEFASVRAVTEQRAVYNVDTGVVKEDGNVIWTNVSAVPVAFPDWKVVVVTTDITKRMLTEKALREKQEKLQEAMDNIKVLDGLLPICMHCKKIRDDKGYWDQLEDYIKNHSEANFTHCICNDCFKKLYPDFVDEDPPIPGGS